MEHSKGSGFFVPFSSTALWLFWGSRDVNCKQIVECFNEWFDFSMCNITTMSFRGMGSPLQACRCSSPFTRGDAIIASFSKDSTVMWQCQGKASTACLRAACSFQFIKGHRCLSTCWNMIILTRNMAAMSSLFWNCCSVRKKGGGSTIVVVVVVVVVVDCHVMWLLCQQRHWWLLSKRRKLRDMNVLVSVLCTSPTLCVEREHQTKLFFWTAVLVGARTVCQHCASVSIFASFSAHGSSVKNLAFVFEWDKTKVVFTLGCWISAGWYITPAWCWKMTRNVKRCLQSMNVSACTGSQTLVVELSPDGTLSQF